MYFIIVSKNVYKVIYKSKNKEEWVKRTLRAEKRKRLREVNWAQQ